MSFWEAVPDPGPGQHVPLSQCHDLFPHVSPQESTFLPIKECLPMSFPQRTVYCASGTEWAQRLPCWNSSESRGQGPGQMV